MSQTLIAAGIAAAVAVFGGSLYVGAQLAEANRHKLSSPAAAEASPAAPVLDPAYAAGTIRIASEMGVTATTLRRRYQEGAEACGTTPEEFWGEHVRSMRHFAAEEALEMNVKLCRMRRQ